MQYFQTDNPFQLRFDDRKSIDGKLLSGKTLGVKDLFHIAGYPTTAGNPSWYMTHPIPENTSPAVQTLLDNGSEMLGKTLTDELAYSLNGQNIHYGTPFNHIYPEQIPGGSSSGSAIAVTNNLVDIGLGTDTGGSIRVPASYNGLFGFRPTHGVISTEHMVALAPSFDTVGWLTKDLSTLTLVADVLLPFDGKDSHAAPNYNLVNAADLIQASEHQSQILHCIEQLNRQSQFYLSNVSTLFAPSNLTLAAEAFRVLQAFEIWQTHGDWINKHKPVFAQDIQDRFADSAKITHDQYTAALAFQAKFKHQIEQLFEQQDFILLPTTPGRAPLSTSSPSDLLTYRTSLMSMTCIAGLAGLPQLHLPLGLHQGRPTGMSLIAKPHADRSLFVAAQRIMEIIN